MINGKKLRLGISGLVYPVWMGRFFWEAFERRNDCEVYTVGPYFDDYIPWAGGIRLPKKYVKEPYLALPTNTAQMRMPYEAIALQMPEDLDFFLQIDAGWHFATRPHARVTALLETDPHCISVSHYAVPKSQSDFTFCMQTPYMQAGEHYLPYAYAPDIHYLEPDTEKIYDVCLIGLHYNSRSALISALQAKGLKVYYNIGDVFDEYRHIYNQSKIALSWSSLDDLCARNWEALAIGNLLVCNRVTDMQTFFSEDEHYLGFSSIDEAVEKVMWALENPELSQRIADAGHRKVIPHTYDKRCAQMLRTCGLR